MSEEDDVIDAPFIESAVCIWGGPERDASFSHSLAGLSHANELLMIDTYWRQSRRVSLIDRPVAAGVIFILFGQKNWLMAQRPDFCTHTHAATSGHRLPSV